MKYIVSFLLLGLLAAPAMAQRPHRGDFKKPDQRVEKHVGEKSCQKECAALKKQVEALRKRLAEVTKSKGKKSDRRGRGVRGGRGDRRGAVLLHQDVPAAALCRHEPPLPRLAHARQVGEGGAT